MKKLILLLIIPTILFAQTYSWSEIEPLNKVRVGHSIVKLNDGNLLVSGNEFYDQTEINKSCEIFDVKLNSWKNTTPLNYEKKIHHTVLLNSGEVLAFGGISNNKCEIFNSEQETWRVTDSIITLRNFGGDTYEKLNDGRILTIGGSIWDTTSYSIVTIDNCELFYPDTETWTETSDLKTPRRNHSSILLNDGRVLVSGGLDRLNKLKSCEIYDPNFSKWEITDSLAFARDSHVQILLDNGNVLVFGGRIYDNIGNVITNTSCEMFNVKTEKWQTVGKLSKSRVLPGVFNNGHNKLLIVGGDTEDTWEIYDLIKNESILNQDFNSQQIISNTNSFQLDELTVLIIGGYAVQNNDEILNLYPSNRCWMFDLTTGVNKEEVLTDKFSLYQNYPNPFNPSTKISYNLPQSGFVSLVILNNLGEKIETLASEYQNVGLHEIDFNSDNLASGIYYYRIQIDGFIKTNKMVLLK